MTTLLRFIVSFVFIKLFSSLTELLVEFYLSPVIAMTVTHSLDRDHNAPSTQERITALFYHRQLFETVDDYPQAGVYDRFGEEWYLTIAYIEGEVHERRRAVEVFLRENAQPGTDMKNDKRQRKELEKVMGQFMSLLFRHAHAVKVAREMALSDSPSKLYMNKYRVNSGIRQATLRAANGEMLSRYGQENEPVPSNLGTLDAEDLEPTAQFIADWLMEPFLDYVDTPARILWSKVPIVGKKYSDSDLPRKYVGASTISAIARCFVCMMAILSLATPIATLDIVKQPKLRIIVMTLFGQAFAAAAQFMGPRFIPLFSLISGSGFQDCHHINQEMLTRSRYFQTMVVFVGTTSS
ncbi:hypothetical protein BKA66DRAFT_165977 [Pyrenochaeta sp. MPI-SDFR-AT-0127]|nr:hypothetical protein BKA66DRAFT_165977 [Pyrenochaeta sp. MPI-SDFR-AT-0127]